MPIRPIPDLNADRKLADDFDVRLSKRAGPDGQPVYSVRISCAVLAGDVVIANYGTEEIWAQLTPNQQDIVEGLIRSAEIKIESLLGL